MFLVRKHNIPSFGFTITELLVTIGLMLIISGVVVARYSSFNSAVLLKNQALEVALSIRQAQLFAVAAQGDAGDFEDQFGIHFDSSAGNNRTYRIFRDNNNDGIFDAGDSEIGIPGELDSRFIIRGFVDADNNTGSASSVLTGGDEFTITFERPNFDAKFADSAGALTNDVVYIEIVLAGDTIDDDNVDRLLRTVEITSAGQITAL
ncbi:MAG: hypothetical protein AAGA35_00740 [Patescibacteria group bacterium]